MSLSRSPNIKFGPNAQFLPCATLSQQSTSYQALLHFPWLHLTSTQTEAEGRAGRHYLGTFRVGTFYVQPHNIIIIIIIIINLSNIPENHKVRELQKTAILGTVHILWKVLT
jgi:hypothetical protein